MTSARKPAAASVQVKFTVELDLKLLFMILSNPDLLVLLFPSDDNATRTKMDALAGAIFLLAVDFSRVHNHLWLDDMASRKLIKEDGSGGYKKVSLNLWRAGKGNLLIPHYRHLLDMKANYHRCLKEGALKGFESWEEVAKADLRLYDSMKKRCHYYFVINDIYKASASTPTTPKPPPTIHPIYPSQSTSPKAIALLHVGKRDRSTASAADLPTTSPKKARVLPNISKIDKLRPHPASTPAAPSPTPGRVSILQPEPARAPSLQPAAASPSPSRSPCQDNDGLSPTTPSVATIKALALGRSAQVAISPATATSPHTPAHGERRDPGSPAVLVSLSSSEKTGGGGVRARNSTDAAVVNLLEVSSGIPASIEDRGSAESSGPLRGIVDRPNAPNAQTTAHTGSRLRTLREIDWRIMASTNVLLHKLFTDPQLRSLLIPTRQPTPADEDASELWKLKRNLYISIMALEPGQIFMKQLKAWGYVGQKDNREGLSEIRACLAWPKEMTYDFGPRLNVLQESWGRGAFQKEYSDHFKPPIGAPSWNTIMRLLYGPPGESAVLEETATNNAPQIGPAPRWRKIPTIIPSPISPPCIDYANEQQNQAGSVNTTFSNHLYTIDPFKAIVLPSTQPGPGQSTTLLLQQPAARTPSSPQNQPARPLIQSDPPRDFLDMMHIARHRDFRTYDLSAERQEAWRQAVSPAEQKDLLALGRAELFIEGLLGCLNNVRPKKLYHKVNLQYQISQSLCLIDRFEDLMRLTGSSRTPMSETDIHYDDRQLRFEIHLLKTSNRSLEGQIQENRTGLCRVYLMEYLEYVGRECRLP